jgi:hypothetical protein
MERAETLTVSLKDDKEPLEIAQQLTVVAKEDSKKAAGAGVVPQPQAPALKREYQQYSWKDKSPDTRLVYIRDLEIAEEEIACFKSGPVGFDMEWKPNYRKGEQENPVALIQLSNEDTILLIQISAMESAIFVVFFAVPELISSNRCSTKSLSVTLGSSFRKGRCWDTGYVVFVHECLFLKHAAGDVKKLWNDYRINTRNCVDLSLLARTVDNARWKGKYAQPIALARLCEAYEELSLAKGKITRSNWERELTDPQQQCMHMILS